MTDTTEALLEEARRRGLNVAPAAAATSAQDALLNEAARRGLNVVEVDDTPLPEPQPDLTLTPNAFGTASVPEISKRAAGAGVLFDKPAAAGHFLSSLAFDEANRVEAFKLSLKRKTGEDVPVRIGPVTGKVEFYDAETKRFSLATPPDATLEQLEALGGPAIALAPEIAIGGLSAIVTKSPALTSTAAGVGTFFGEAGRLFLGQQLGINQDVTDTEIFLEAGQAAGIAMGAGLAGEKLAVLGKAVFDLIRGRAVPRSTLESLDLNIEDAQQIADLVNDRIEGEKLKFSLAQASGNEDLLALEDGFRRNPAFRAEFGQFEQEQAAALDSFYDTINRGYRSRSTQAEVEAGVRGVAGAAVDREIARGEIPVARARGDLERALTGIRERDPATVGPLLREVGDEEQTAFTEWAKDAAQQLDALAGGAAFIPNGEVAAVAGSIDRELRDAIFPKLQSGDRSLIGNLDFDDAPLFDPNHRWTFSQAWNAISALKRAIRVSSKGLSTDDPATGTLKRFVSALEVSLKDATERSSLGDAYADFTQRYAAEKARLDEGTVGLLMARDGGAQGRFRVNDERVFNRVFPRGGSTEAEEVYSLIRHRPEAMQGMRQALGDFYKRSVVKDGRIDLARHEKWWKDHGKQVEIFFRRADGSVDRDGLANIRRVGNFEKVLQAREQARDRALSQINKSFDAELANLNSPGAILRLATDARNPERVHQLVKILETNKAHDVLRGVRAEARKAMREKVTGPFQVTGGTDVAGVARQFSAARFDTFLNGKAGETGQAEVLKALFGAQYVGDLQVLNQALKTAARETKFPNRSNTAFWAPMLKNLTRAYVGLFTRPGRFLTALDGLRGRAANRILVNTILRPDDLRELVKNRGIDLRTRQGIAFMSAIGGGALVQNFNVE